MNQADAIVWQNYFHVRDHYSKTEAYLEPWQTIMTELFRKTS